MSATIIRFPATQANDAEYAAYVARFEQRLADSPWMRETLARAQATVGSLPARAPKRIDLEADLLMFQPKDRERARQLLQEVGQAMCKLPRKR